MPDGAQAAYTYDAPIYDAHVTDSARERGPPSAAVTHITYDAVDLRPHGPSARPSGLTAPPIATYDYPAVLAHAVADATTTSGHTGSIDGDLSARSASQAAANIGAQSDHIVLGLRPGLEDVATKVGGRTLLKDPEWMASLQRSIADPSTRFSVSLGGMSGS